MPDPSPAQPVADDVFDSVREPLLVLAADLTVRRANQAFYRTFRVDPAATVGRRLYDLGDGQWDIPELLRQLNDVVPLDSTFDDFEVTHDFPGVGRKVMLLNARRVNGAGGDAGTVLLGVEDVTARRERDDSLLADQNRVLQQMLRGGPLADVLDALCLAAEGQIAAGSIATVLLADAGGTLLRPAAGGRCPPAYAAAIDPVPIGPAAGSCGTAMARGEPVVVADIATDPLWAAYRDLALPHGLRACWSIPIPSSAGAILGTFAVYSRVPRRPAGRDLRVLELLARTAGIAVERRRAEEAVREARSRLESTLAAGEVGTWEFDVVNDAIRADANLARMFGLTPAAAGGGPHEAYLAAIHPDDRGRVAATLGRAIADGDRYEADYRLDGPGGAVRWVVARGRVERDAAGRATRLPGVVVDVTAQRRAEDALRANEEQFRTLFETMDEGYCIIDIIADAAGHPVDFRYTLANPAFVNHTGMVDVVGRTVREMLPNYEQHLVETYARVAETGEPLRFVDRVGDLGRWFDLSAFRVGGPGSRRVAVLFADITARKRAEADSRRLASIAEHSPDFIGISDADGTPIFVNPAGRRLVGLPPDLDARRTAIPDYFVPEQRAFVADTVLPAILTDGRWTGELSFRHFETGAAIPVLYDLFRVDDPATGKPVNFATVTRDLSGQKRAEAMVRETDERLRLVLGATADYAVVVTDPAGRVTDWLGGAEAITGFTKADAVGRPVDRIFTAGDRAAGVPAREMATAAAAGRAEDKRWYAGRDGREFFADGVMVPVLAGGDLRGFAKVFRDATGRQRAEDGVRFLADASAALGELVDYESTLRRIANLAVAGFADWCVVDVLDDRGDRRRLAVTTAEAAEVAAARAADAAFRPEEGAEGVVPHVLRSGRPEAVPDLAAVDPAVAPQGPDRVARLLALGVRSYLCVPLVSRGRVIGGVTFLSASTRRRFGPAEQRVGEALAERVTTAIENARLYTAIQEQDRRKGEFLATLAHELRNPLAPVRSGVQILRGTGAAGKTLDMMDRQVNQLVHLVDDLMDVSRVSSGKVVLRPERLDLKGVVEAAVETSRQLIDAAGHTLAVEPSPEPLELDADRTRLVQVLANLLNNAAKYTPNGGRITLTTARDGADAVVRVADTGLGIAADMLPKVFDMFTQVGSSLDRSQGGLGIGLTLVRRLVELHGGRVAADSPGPGRGSTFTVRLPLATAPAPTGSAGGPAAPGVVGPLDVLVVDDNHDAAESLAMLLEMKGHRVRTAHDGPAALGVLATSRPAVVFLDIGLPGMSGYEVARRVRESVALRGVTLVALTGWGQEEDRRRTREAGFDHHLVKPVDFRELETVLTELSRA